MPCLFHEKQPCLVDLELSWVARPMVPIKPVNIVVPFHESCGLSKLPFRMCFYASLTIIVIILNHSDSTFHLKSLSLYLRAKLQVYGKTCTYKLSHFVHGVDNVCQCFESWSAVQGTCCLLMACTFSQDPDILLVTSWYMLSLTHAHNVCTISSL